MLVFHLGETWNNRRPTKSSQSRQSTLFPTSFSLQNQFAAGQRLQTREDTSYKPFQLWTGTCCDDDYDNDDDNIDDDDGDNEMCGRWRVGGVAWRVARGWGGEGGERQQTSLHFTFRKRHVRKPDPSLFHVCHQISWKRKRRRKQGLQLAFWKKDQNTQNVTFEERFINRKTCHHHIRIPSRRDLNQPKAKPFHFFSRLLIE